MKFLSTFSAAGLSAVVYLCSTAHAVIQPDDSSALWQRITESDVAAALGLSDDQKASIASIITERDESLANADDSGKAEIHAAAAQKLKDTLTAEQQQTMTQLFGGVRLRFNFQAQKWNVVLKYFAEEADLELVMDEAPPGVFNFSSNQEYTPTEAIDLLNGWLLTRGYTLVRRDNLLMCLNLQKGLPDGAIPRVTPDELEERGRFEFLSMLIPLEGRPAEATVKEIQPFVGTYGKVEPLAATGQILVTASGKSLKEIQRIVQQIPVPRTPPKKPDPPPPPKPVLQIYPIEHANPDRAGEVLKSLINGTLFVDGKARQISVNAVPAEQDKAKAIIDQLEANQGPDQQSVLKVYPLETDSPDELIETLKLAASSAQFRYDDATDKLIVWAKEDDQGVIVRSIRDLEAVQFSESTRLQVYPLDDVAPEVARELIVSVLPKSKVTVDARTSSLIAVGTLSDHQAIAALLEQLQPRTMAVKPSGVKPYPVDPAISEMAVTIIKSVVPEAEVTPDPTNDRLLIIAPPAKHAIIRETLQQLTDNLSKKDRQLRSYDARDIDVPSVIALLDTLTPDADVKEDAANMRLRVIASAEDHVQVANVLEQVAHDPDSNRQKIAGYPLSDNVDQVTVSSLVSTLAPDATLTFDTKNRRLLVTANDADQAKVSGILQQLTSDLDTDEPRVKSYPLAEGVNADTVTSLVKQLIPDVLVTNDADGRRLLITATDEDHARIAETIAQVEQDARGEVPDLRYFPLERADGDNAVSILEAMFPKATIRFEKNARRLSVVAMPADLKDLEVILGRLEAATPRNERRTLKVYDVTQQQRARFTAVVDSLQSELPGLQVLADAQPGELTVWARPSQLEIIDGVLQQLKHDLPADQQRTLYVLPITQVDPLSVSEVLTELFPDASIKVDEVASRLLIRARPVEYETIKGAVEQLDSATDGPREIKVMVYPVKGINPDSAMSLIQTQVPKVNIVRDDTAQTFIVTGRLKDQEKVAALLDTLKASASPLENRIPKSYPSFHSDSRQEREFFSAAFPDSNIIIDEQSKTMTIIATAEDHERIEAIITALADANTEYEQSDAVSYDIPGINAEELRQLLDQVVPKARKVIAPNRLLVWADPGDHDVVRRVVDGMLSEHGDKSVAAFDVKAIGTATARQILVDVAPDTTFLDSADGRSLIATVDEETRARIETTLAGLADSPAATSERTVRFYDASQAGPNASAVLQRMYPDSVVSSGSQPDQLMVEASESTHGKVDELLKQLRTAARDDSRQLRFYPVTAVARENTVRVLAATVPGVTLSSSEDGTRLMAVVKAIEHEKIQNTLETLASENPFDSDRTLRFYDVTDAGPEVTGVLQRMVATAAISAGSQPGQLMVEATDSEHQDIEHLIAQLKNAATDDGSELQFYNVDRDLIADAQTVITSTVEDVTTTVSADGSRLIARVTPEQHSHIEQALARLKESHDGMPQTTLSVYDITGADPEAVRSVVASLVDDTVRLTVDPAGKQLYVRASETQQETIRQTIEQVMAGDGLLGNAVFPTVYHADKVDGEQLRTMVEDLFPGGDVRLSVNGKTGALIAIGMRSQHEAISALVDQLNADTNEKVSQKLAIYRVAPMRADVVMNALEPLVPASVTLSAERNGEELLVSAPPEEQKKIAELVEQIKANRIGADGFEARTYRMPPYEADEARQVLSALFEDATFVTNRTRDILVATATAEQHKTIDQIVRQMRGDMQDEGGPVPKSYPLKSADGKATLDVLEDMFDRTDDVRLTLDERNKAIVAVARPEQHRTIATLLSELDPQDGAGARSLQEYSLFGKDSGAIVHVINGLMQEADPGATVAFQHETQVLMLTTTDEGHETAKKTIARFRPLEHQHSEVFQLSYLDPHAARHAIELLISNGILDQKSRPQIHVDDDSQQLWVRARQRQLDEMRALLKKMGEENLEDANDGAGASTDNLRVIQVGNDVDGAIERIRDLTQKLGGNPVRVLTPGGEKRESTPGQFSVPAEDPEVLKSDAAGEDENAATDSSPSPIVVIPGDRRITIASEDTVALDQLEAALRKIYARRPRGRNKDFSIYQLNNAGASDVATTLEEIFEEDDKLSSFGTVVLVPENRLNALIVFGSRSDRDRVEQLLEILDSEQVQDTRRAYQTKVVPVRHSDARRIETILEGIYKTQMSTGGSRSTIDIPKGVPAEVATVLRQINAASASPLLTIEVQRDTNSLIVKAPRNLLDEVEQLVADLDRSSENNRARGIRLLSLKKASSARVMDILQDVLD